MAPNVTTSGLSPVRERAALRVAEDGQSDAAIASACGIAKRTLERWKREPAFAVRVEQIRAELRAAVLAEGIADRRNRVEALNDRWRRLQQVIAARAEEHADVPGGHTGLLLRQVKLVKAYTTPSDDPKEEMAEVEVLFSAKRFVEMAEYALDTGLLRELREHEKQAAQELGQWTDKVDQSGHVTVRVVYDDTDGTAPAAA